MNVAVAKTGTGRAPGDLFASAEGRLPGSPAVAAVRRAAFESYERLGLPHRRLEEWKYTDLRALVGEVLPLAAAPDAAALKRAAEAVKAHAIEGARKLVLVDGVFAADLSDVKALASGVRLTTLREALEKDAGLLTTTAGDAMIALNAAMATDGVNALRSPKRAMVVITHYQRLLNYIVPDVVHVMSKGRVVKSGGKDLALELEASGYAQFEDAA